MSRPPRLRKPSRPLRVASWIGAVGVPLVWVVHLLVCVTLVSISCEGGVPQHNATPWPDIRTVIYVVSAVAFVLALAGAIAACRAWRTTASLPVADDGAARFIAWCGAVAGGGFAVGLVFTSCVLLAEPVARLCEPFQ